MDCWTLPIICTNAIVASAVSLTPSKAIHRMSCYSTPFSLGSFPPSFSQNLVFPPSSKLRSSGQGAQGGLIQPPISAVVLVSGSGVERSQTKANTDRAAGTPVPRTLNPEANSMSDISLA